MKGSIWAFPAVQSGTSGLEAGTIGFQLCNFCFVPCLCLLDLFSLGWRSEITFCSFIFILPGFPLDKWVARSQYFLHWLPIHSAGEWDRFLDLS